MSDWDGVQLCVLQVGDSLLHSSVMPFNEIFRCEPRGHKDESKIHFINDIMRR